MEIKNKLIVGLLLLSVWSCKKSDTKETNDKPKTEVTETKQESKLDAVLKDVKKCNSIEEFETFLKEFNGNLKKAESEGKSITASDLEVYQLPKGDNKLLGYYQTKSGFNLNAFYSNEMKSVNLILLKDGKYTTKPENLEGMGMGQGVINVISQTDKLKSITEKDKIKVEFGDAKYEEQEDYFHPSN